jgi:V-type H+-transporting ATPase subunit D
MSEVPPTRMNQQIFKGKKKAAESGHKLLKKKADALKVRRFDFLHFLGARFGDYGF